MTKYNLRPAGLLGAPEKEFAVDIPIRLERYSLDAGRSLTNSYCVTSSAECSSAGDSDGNYTEYPAKGRTVCSIKASSELCSAFSAGGNSCNDGDDNFTASCTGLWKTDTNFNNSIGPFLSYIESKGNGSKYNVDTARNLLLLESQSGYGLPYCRSVTSTVGTYDKPAVVTGWGTYCVISKGVTNCSNIWGNPSDEISTRCYLDKLKAYYYLSTGGGGSAGAYVENIEIPNEAIEKYFDNKDTRQRSFDISVGRGGKAGDFLYEKGEQKSGRDGEATSVKIVRGPSTIWSYTVLGGKGGGGASYKTAGIGGKALSLETSCRPYLSGHKSENIPCTKTSEDGESGIVGQRSPNKYAISKASGASSAISAHGYGGSGGYFRPGSTKATDGSNGYAKITYEVSALGIPGGGGGGGAYAKIMNVPVGSSAELYVTVGVGGSASSLFDGNDGGDSSIVGMYVAGGGKGGKKGTPEGISTVLKLGTAGEGGVLNPITLKSDVKGESNNGQKGFDGVKTSDSSFTIGGNGGASGASVSMQILEKSLINACGGFVSDKKDCYDSTGGLVSANGSQFEFKKPSKLYQKGDFGSAGQGGAGGGWKFDGLGYTYTGNGGKGNDGYVYIWW